LLSSHNAKRLAPPSRGGVTGLAGVPTRPAGYPIREAESLGVQAPSENAMRCLAEVLDAHSAAHPSAKAHNRAFYLALPHECAPPLERGREWSCVAAAGGVSKRERERVELRFGCWWCPKEREGESGAALRLLVVSQRERGREWSCVAAAGGVSKRERERVELRFGCWWCPKEREGESGAALRLLVVSQRERGREWSCVAAAGGVPKHGRASAHPAAR
jgi:hypothetical protein